MHRPSHVALRGFLVAAICLCGLALDAQAQTEDLALQLRYQVETSPGSGQFHRLSRSETWDPHQSAIIVCDVWDLHHCLNAVRRVEQFAPRLNEVLKQARALGATIIHAPSDCMATYDDHPARRRAVATPRADFQPHDIQSWCSVIPAEERAHYPIDQSDGGEDDDPTEHAEWAAKLRSLGRNPATPWLAQSDLITIDADQDYISDRGDEIWNVLQSRGVRNVILTGVHTNMCVLGRPFGLRQMARNGKNVVLMRDMTDTMYNPRRWPYVSHFTGTDLIISHIERFVCPTITSDQFLGGKPFRFAEDARPHLVMVIAEDEYGTDETLPSFARDELGRHFRVSVVFGSDQQRNEIPGLRSALEEADLLLVSVRRRVLPAADMAALRRFVASGKPVVGLRTASHAFSLRGKASPNGLEAWPEFDADVFGGNYHGHHANNLPSTVQVDAAVRPHPILAGMTDDPFPQGGSLYRTSPLASGATILLTGQVEGHPAEPAAWTFQRAGGGCSFYTSMGHVDDFQHPEFVRLLTQGIYWAAGISLPEQWKSNGTHAAFTDHWSNLTVPGAWEDAASGAWRDYDGVGWYRCVPRIGSSWIGERESLSLTVPQPTGGDDSIKAWINGHALFKKVNEQLEIKSDWITPDDANLLVLRVEDRDGEGGLRQSPVLRSGRQEKLELRGRWQFRLGDDPSWSNMPLPAKFGASTDIVFTTPEPLFVARPLTRPGEFTPGIEGPACDAEGNVFAVNFARQGAIGRVTPEGVGEVFVDLPKGSVGNGIRFDPQGAFYVADYTGHNILRVDPETREITTFAHHAGMNQPNDLAIAPDGTLFASDPNWERGTGGIWRIDVDGGIVRLVGDMGTTNGIEVSPDGGTLYVNESVQRNIWAFQIEADRTLTGKRLVRKFDDHGFDGMRCDVDGNLYVTRYGKGTVVKLTPDGDISREIHVLGSRPSNLCFGGPDGRTVYVTEVEFARLVQFRVDRPGATWRLQR